MKTSPCPDHVHRTVLDREGDEKPHQCNYYANVRSYYLKAYSEGMQPWAPWAIQRWLAGGPAFRTRIAGLQLDTFYGGSGWKVLIMFSHGALTQHGSQALQFIQQIVTEWPQERGNVSMHAGGQQGARVPPKS